MHTETSPKMIETGKLTGAIYLHNPKHPENYNHPETGRQNYIYGIAYECAQYNKSVAELLKELINQFKNEYEIEDDVEDDWVISVGDLQNVIMELER
jgi:hypothetical protein